MALDVLATSGQVMLSFSDELHESFSTEDLSKKNSLSTLKGIRVC